MLPFVRPAWKLVALSTIANVLFSVSNALILAVVEPIFRFPFLALHQQHRQQRLLLLYMA